MNKSIKLFFNKLLAFLLVGVLSLQINCFPVGAGLTVDSAQSADESSPSQNSESDGSVSSTSDDPGSSGSGDSNGNNSDDIGGSTDDSSGGSSDDSNSSSTDDSNGGSSDDSNDGSTDDSNGGSSAITDENVESPDTDNTAGTDIAEGKDPVEETDADELPIEEIILSDRFMDEWGASTVIVSSYAELASALSKDNGYEYIYLANDIMQGSNAGISIHSSKKSVVIDGLAPGSDEPATFTQRASSTFTNTIYVDNTVTTKLRLCNINMVGKNYYGIVSISDAVYDFELIYDDISYTGPQMTYNRHGSAHYSNSTITIARDASGGSAAQEVAEAAEVFFSDLVTIDSESTSAMFQLTGAITALTLNAGAEVQANSNYCFINASGSTSVINLFEDARLTYTGQRYGLLADAQRLQSLHLHEGAGLFVTQTARNYVYGTLYIQDSLQLDEGCSLVIDRAAGGSAIQFYNDGASATFNNPERVKLYAPSKSLISYQRTGTLDIGTDAANIWSTSNGFTNDSINNYPSCRWNKLDSEKLIISSSFNRSDQTIESNLDGSDFPEHSLDSNTFNLGNSQMLVFGQFELTADPVYEDSADISGNTEQDVFLRIAILGSKPQLIEGRADGNEYRFSISDKLAANEFISIWGYKDYLNKRELTTVLPAAEILRIDYLPSVLDFGSISVPAETSIVERSNNEAWYIEIEDTRKASSDWSLMVSIETPLTAVVEGSSYMLNNALIFMDEGGNQTALSENQLRVASGCGNNTTRWDDDKGILLYADPGEIFSNSAYTATLQWSLQDAP